MSSTYAEPLDRLDGVLDELAAISPAFRTRGERREFLLRVVGEVVDWVGHSPEKLQAMRDGLTALREQGAAVIED